MAENRNRHEQFLSSPSVFKGLVLQKCKNKGLLQKYRICHDLTVEIKIYKTSLGKCNEASLWRA